MTNDQIRGNRNLLGSHYEFLHYCAVHALQVELGELKGRLTEVISNCDALCKRIATEGPESLQSSVRPLTAASTDQNTISVLPSLPPLTEEDQLPQQAN